MKTMRSDVVKRNMKVHVKRNEAHPTTKIKHDEDDPHEEDQPTIKKKWYVLDDDELEKIIYKTLYDVKVIKEEMNVEESENDKESENDLENDKESENDKKYENDKESENDLENEKESENDIEVEKDKIDDEDENEINVENEKIDDEENNMCEEESGDKKLLLEEQKRLNSEIWCSPHY